MNAGQIFEYSFDVPKEKKKKPSFVKMKQRART